MVEPAAAPRGADQARLAAIALLSALIAGVVVAMLQDATGGAALAAMAVFLLVPLLLPLRGILRRDRRTFAWATLCLTPHFVYALTEIVANPDVRALAAAMFVLSLGLTIALVAYLRFTRGQGQGIGVRD